jgi:hypothetical protein
MIIFSEEGIDVVRTYVAKAAARHGFHKQAENMLYGRDKYVLNIRANMFLCIGINCSGQTVNMTNCWNFIRKGANRFFLSLKNRQDLAEDMFKNDVYKGKYNIACDFYVGPAVFDSSIVSDNVIDEWNEMMEPIVVKGRHGIKVVRVILDGGDSTDVKYRWVNRTIGTSRKKK